jgi:hypothetical protein
MELRLFKVTRAGSRDALAETISLAGPDVTVSQHDTKRERLKVTSGKVERTFITASDAEAADWVLCLKRLTSDHAVNVTPSADKEKLLKFIGVTFPVGTMASVVAGACRAIAQVQYVHLTDFSGDAADPSVRQTADAVVLSQKLVDDLSEEEAKEWLALFRLVDETRGVFKRIDRALGRLEAHRRSLETSIADTVAARREHERGYTAMVAGARKRIDTTMGDAQFQLLTNLSIHEAGVLVDSILSELFTLRQRVRGALSVDDICVGRLETCLRKQADGSDLLRYLWALLYCSRVLSSALQSRGLAVTFLRKGTGAELVFARLAEATASYTQDLRCAELDQRCLFLVVWWSPEAPGAMPSMRSHEAPVSFWIVQEDSGAGDSIERNARLPQTLSDATVRLRKDKKSVFLAPVPHFEVLQSSLCGSDLACLIGCVLGLRSLLLQLNERGCQDDLPAPPPLLHAASGEETPDVKNADETRGLKAALAAGAAREIAAEEAEANAMLESTRRFLDDVRMRVGEELAEDDLAAILRSARSVATLLHDRSLDDPKNAELLKGRLAALRAIFSRDYREKLAGAFDTELDRVVQGCGSDGDAFARWKALSLAQSVHRAYGWYSSSVLASRLGQMEGRFAEGEARFSAFRIKVGIASQLQLAHHFVAEYAKAVHQKRV